MYREARIPTARETDLPAEALLCEVARILSAHRPEYIDEGTVIEACATWMLDVGEYHMAHRFSACLVGIALGFCGHPKPEVAWNLYALEEGHKAGADIRTIYDAMREAA